MSEPCWGPDRYEDRYLDVGEHHVRYWDVGEGRAVLFIHGLGASADAWVANVSAVAEHGRAIALDLPGFGLSVGGKVSYTPSYAAEFLGQFLDVLGVERATLVGNSMGGLIALRFALDHPSRTEGLVLVDSAGLGREVSGFVRLATLPLFGLHLSRRRSAEELVDGTLRSVVSNPQAVPRGVIRRWIKMLDRLDLRDSVLAAARAGVNLFGQRPEVVLLDRLHEVSAPTLIVWGGEDPVIPVTHAFRAQVRLPSARLHVFSNCRHCPQIERPDEFNDLLCGFLNDEERAA